jgi:hypothetical protein
VPVLSIELLGRWEVRGWVTDPGARSPVMSEIAVALAVHRKGLTAAGLLAKVWRGASDDGRDVQRETVTQALSRFRGFAPEGTLPPAGPDGYVLGAGLQVSWWRFEDLVAEADQLQRTSPAGVEGVAELLGRAIAMVRWRPLEGASADGPLAWAVEDGSLSKMQRVVTDTGHRLARIALQVGDAEHARWAAEQAQPADWNVEVL